MYRIRCFSSRHTTISILGWVNTIYAGPPKAYNFSANGDILQPFDDAKDLRFMSIFDAEVEADRECLKTYDSFLIVNDNDDVCKEIYWSPSVQNTKKNTPIIAESTENFAMNHGWIPAKPILTITGNPCLQPSYNINPTGPWEISGPASPSGPTHIAPSYTTGSGGVISNLSVPQITQHVPTINEFVGDGKPQEFSITVGKHKWEMGSRTILPVLCR